MEERRFDETVIDSQIILVDKCISDAVCTYVKNFYENCGCIYLARQFCVKIQ